MLIKSLVPRRAISNTITSANGSRTTQRTLCTSFTSRNPTSPLHRQLPRQRYTFLNSFTALTIASSFHILPHLRTLATLSSTSFIMPSSNETFPTPPVLPPSWSTYTASYITSVVDSQIESSQQLLDKIGKLNKDECTFESTAKALATHDAEEAKLIEPALFLQYVSTDKEVRDKSSEAEKKMQDFSLEAMTRVDVYKALLNAQENVKVNGTKLTAEEQRLLEKMILDRTRSGLGLDDSKRAELLKLRQKISKLEVDFAKTCNEESGFLMLTKEELEGVPEEVVKGYPIEDGKHKVTFKTPDITPLFKYANSSETRKKAVLGFEGKTLSNAPLLEEIVKLRRSAAQLLGYPDHASYILEEKMAKSPKNVFDFLDDLKTRLSPIAEKEKEKLLALKKEVVEARGEKFDGKFYLWDYRYYDRLYVEKSLSLDDEKIKEYFPVQVVVPAVLDLYRRLLNIKFFKVPNADLWHEDTEVYAVWDAKNSDEFLGYMYLDLFPRPAAYGHAAVWGLIPGYTGPDGARHYLVVAMKANLAKPMASRPALLQHDQVVTFMHELGHAFHGLCSKTAFAKFHGTAVARDFDEAPSQMLENWTWTPAQLKEISSHFERPSETLDDATISNLIKSKNVNQGLFNLRQLHFGMFDMKVHTTDVDSDLTKLWCDSREATTGISNGGEYVGGQSGFAHITGGYSAGYYGYLYSQVFSADMFKTVFEKDPMNAQAGLNYRNKILLPGGSRDAMDLLKDFLGREPNNKAFLETLSSEV